MPLPPHLRLLITWPSVIKWAIILFYPSGHSDWSSDGHMMPGKTIRILVQTFSNWTGLLFFPFGDWIFLAISSVLLEGMLPVEHREFVCKSRTSAHVFLTLISYELINWEHDLCDASSAVVISSSRTSKQSRRIMGGSNTSLQCLSDYMLLIETVGCKVDKNVYRLY